MNWSKSSFRGKCLWHYHQALSERKRLVPEERVKVRLVPKSEVKGFWELARKEF